MANVTLDRKPAPDPIGPARAGEVLLRARSVKKSFVRNDGTTVTAIDDASFEVTAGEFIVLLGPSGCGKTTLLRTVAGLERADSGEVEIEGRTVFSSEGRTFVPPEGRRLSMVFQNYALWPHMDAQDNVAFVLRSGRKVSKAQARERAREVLDLVGVGALATQYPSQMSGGQQQRVALARALAPGRRVVLFDEPLSNVDAKVREVLRSELMDMQRLLGFAALYVTHDQTEALQMADRVAVLHDGRIEQFAAPDEIYHHPVSLYVGNFIGSANQLRGRVRIAPGPPSVSSPIGPVLASVSRSGDGADGVAFSRPESWELLPIERRAEWGQRLNVWVGRVQKVCFSGAYTEYTVTVDGQALTVWVPGRGLRFDPGEDVMVHVSPDAVSILPTEGRA